MANAKPRPGVMLYFDSVRPALNRLDNEACGALFRAILNYAEYGELIELDPMTGMVFDLLRPKLDRDAERYEEGREQRQYATYCREVKKKGEQPQTFDRWKALNALKAVGSPSPSPFDSSASPFPAPVDVGDTDGDVVGDGDTVGDVVGYQPLSDDIGSILSDRYTAMSEDAFEKQRQIAIEKLRAGRKEAF